MDQGTLVREQIEAGARFLQEFEKSMPVKSAYWLKTGEASRPYLYVVPDQAGGTNFDHAAGELYRIDQEMRDPDFDSFRVKFIRADDPVARAIAQLQQLYPGKGGFTRFRGSMLGNVFAEDLYVYPSPVGAAGS